MNVQGRKKNPDHTSSILGGSDLYDPPICRGYDDARLVRRGAMGVSEKTGYCRGQQKKKNHPHPSSEEDRDEANGR